MRRGRRKRGGRHCAVLGMNGAGCSGAWAREEGEGRGREDGKREIREQKAGWEEGWMDGERCTDGDAGRHVI